MPRGAFSSDDMAVLPPHLIELLRACRIKNSTETKVLAAHLGLSAATVNIYFHRIAEALRTTDRFSSVQTAFRRGLLLSPDENLLVNSDFTEGMAGPASGNSLPWTSVLCWLPLAGGTPQWVMPEADGEPGAIQFWGAADTGEAIYQVLPSGLFLRRGKTYRFSAEYRFGPVRRDWPITPRQPMYVDFVVRASLRGLSSYTAPDEPGVAATLGRLHYARREPSHFDAPPSPMSPEEVRRLRRRAGLAADEAVRSALENQRAGGRAYWEWEQGMLSDWTADGDYNCLTLHPTNDLVVGTDSSNPNAPNELAWGQIRHVRLLEVL